MIKYSRKAGMELPELDLKKYIYTTGITLNGEKLSTFSLRVRTQQGCLFYPLLLI
jgi:hypothetical protein